MKIKIKIKISFIIASILLFNSCETTEKIEDFPLKPPKLVVNCFFSQDSIWEFQVSKSLSVLDNAELKLIENASIKLFKDSELVETITGKDHDGLYRSYNNLPEAGHEYSIEVSTPDFDKTLTASEKPADMVPVHDVFLTLQDTQYYEGTHYDGRSYFSGRAKGTFGIQFQDPMDRDNYYQLAVYYLDTVFNDDSTHHDVYRRELSISSEDGAVETEGNSVTKLLFTDNYFDGQKYQIKIDFYDWRARRDRVYFVELNSLSRSGFLYKTSIDKFSLARNDPFAEPVQIFCNIENGFGIFSGYSTSIFEISF